MDVHIPLHPTLNAMVAVMDAPGPALDPGPMVTGAPVPLAPLPLTEEAAGMALNRALHTIHGHAHGLLEVTVAVREDANTLHIETCPPMK